MQPTPKQAERLRQLEAAVKKLDSLSQRDRPNSEEIRTMVRTVADALESLRILVAQTIDAL